MNGRLMFFFVITVIYLIADIYTFVGLKSLLSNKKVIKVFTICYTLLSLFVYYQMTKVYDGMQSGSVVRDNETNFAIGIFFTFFITKLVFSSGMILHDGGRMLAGIYNFVSSRLSENNEFPQILPSRRKFITTMTAFVSAVPFFTLLYGITRGKYKFDLTSTPLAFNDLPKNFNGFKIVQISDIHAGSLDSQEEVEKAVDLINEQNPDLILFTGDLINSQKEEVDPYLKIFGKLKAKHGKFAVLGNHDYYGLWELEESEHAGYMSDFFRRYDEMGFKLLNNDNETIKIGDETIKIVGVENWGAGRWFPKKGDLDAALKGVEGADFTVLISHDPTHWDKKVKDHHKHVHLTLSGHTHGMQFGINMPGFKWSPVQYRYKHWMGLYEEKGQYLYVNRGFGFLGFPGRVGMWPEISCFELIS